MNTVGSNDHKQNSHINQAYMKLRRLTICGNILAVFALARFNALGNFRLRIIHRSVKEISFNREHKQRYHSGCHNANADTLFNALSRDI